MPTPTLPAFSDPVHQTQQTFRALLDALARPGQIYPLALTPSSPPLETPRGLFPACGAAGLTLLDLDTTVWLQPGIAEAVRHWLLFHTGCRLVESPSCANFAILQPGETMPPLSDFQRGTAEEPETSTTLLIQVDGFDGGPAVRLTGPGIPMERAIAPQLPPRFWAEWQANHAAYPLGVDAFLFTPHAVMGLPRSTQGSADVRV